MSAVRAEEDNKQAMDELSRWTEEEISQMVGNDPICCRFRETGYKQGSSR